MAPESRLLLVIDVGPRTLATAQGGVHQIVQVLAPACVPLFLTDGFREYTVARIGRTNALFTPAPARPRPLLIARGAGSCPSALQQPTGAACSKA